MAKKVQKKAAKKASKPAKKTAKKTAKKASKTVKKSKSKPAAKKASKPVKKGKKTVAKKATKPVAKKTAKKAVKKAPQAKVKPVAVKPAPVKTISKANVKPTIGKTAPKAKVEDTDLDDDDRKPAKKEKEYEPVFEYKPQARPKPMGSQPKPFIGQDKRTKYSDDELKEFREIILSKLEEAKKDYELLKSTLSHKDDHGTDDTSPTFKLLEDGSDVMTREETAQLAARQEKFIQALQNALVRIENKTYGICRVSGKLIPKERLRSVPHATLSIDAKLEQY